MHDRRHGKSTGSSCQFFVENHLGDGVSGHPTIFFFMPQAQISECSKFFPEIPGEFFFLIQFFYSGHDQPIHRIPDHLPEEFLLFGKSEIKRHELLLSSFLKGSRGLGFKGSSEKLLAKN
ncbi:MAG: hypothetical protein COZ69_15425 [Deltaproteobacteria bacterium CG_4_8_14_3_um_filter_45_9]|nr:MAG: hypothetical protein COZ69_15425 [Deltaproteobacteria bacterium CG_4_8_14_3_um_filter_45_9]